MRNETTRQAWELRLREQRQAGEDVTDLLPFNFNKRQVGGQ